MSQILKRYHAKHPLERIKVILITRTLHHPFPHCPTWSSIPTPTLTLLSCSHTHSQSLLCPTTLPTPLMNLPTRPRRTLHHSPFLSTQCKPPSPQYPLLSPQTALNALTTQTDLNETVPTITYGLVSTIHNREVLHALESKCLAKSNDELTTTNRDLCKRLERYSRQADRELELPLQPIGYEDNNGRVATQVPIGDRYYANAKWIKLQPDR
jgi:hypothetical protein